MKKLIRTHHSKGFTLLEVTLGIAIGAVLLASLLMVFKIGKQSWNVNNQESELLQHTRLAMSRLSSELRYAKGLTQANMLVIEFPTAVLINTDDTTIETIRYEIIGNTLQRSVDSGVKQLIAGDSTAGGVMASFSNVTPVKLSVTNDVIPLIITDPLSVAVGLIFEFNMQDSSGKRVTVKTLVNFRDK